MEVDDLNDSLLASLISSLQTELLQQRITAIERIIEEILPEVDVNIVNTKIFNHVMPVLEILYTEVLSKIKLLFESEDYIQNSTVNTLQEYLGTCIQMLNILECIIQYIEDKNLRKFHSIQSVVLNSFQIFLFVFQHCKDCDQMYKTNCDLTTSILHLFKGCQKLNSKVILILNQITYEITDQGILMQVLEIVLDAMQTLVGINTKTMADNCKAYIALISKTSHILNGKFDIVKPVEFFTHEIRGQLSDTQSSTENIKMTNFFLRATLKLFEIFLINVKGIINAVINFLCSIYAYYVPQLLRTNGYRNSISETFEICDSFLSKLLSVEDLDLHSVFNCLNSTSTVGVLILYSKILEKVCDKTHLIEKDNIDLLTVSLEILSKNGNELLVPASCSTLSIYDSLMINITTLIFQLNLNDYKAVEFILYKNMCCSNVWKSLLVSDIWYLLLKQGSEQLVFETLEFLIENHSYFVCANPITSVLEHFMKRVYILLPVYGKQIIFEKYAPTSCTSVWKIVGLNSIPDSGKAQLEFVVKECNEKSKELISGGITFETFKHLIECFQILSEVSSNLIFDAHFVSIFNNLWKLNFQDSFITTNTLGNIFIRYFLQMTNSHLSILGENLFQEVIKQSPNLMKISSIEMLFILSKLSQNNKIKKTLNQMVTELKGRSVIQLYLLEILHLDLPTSSSGCFNWINTVDYLNGNVNTYSHTCFKNIIQNPTGKEVDVILNTIRSNVELLTEASILHKKATIVDVIKKLQRLLE